jgi:alkaline phosphatase D
MSEAPDVARRILHLADQWRTNRRGFLAAGAAWAVVPFLSRVCTAEVEQRPTFPKDPFTLGVASGDPTSDGMVLWTRLAPDPLNGGGLPGRSYPVKWEIFADDQLRQLADSGTTLATPSLGHSVHVEVAGLAPDRWYWYRFTCGDAVSPVGRTRTMPAAGVVASKLRFAFASCNHYETGYFTAYGHMAQEDLDLTLHLGDYIYEYAGKADRVRKHLGDEIQSLDDYRNRYAQYKSDPLFQAAHANCPWLVVWDDHEVDNNYANAVSEEEGVSPEALLARRANAYQAYYENMPLRRNAIPHGPDMQLYRVIDFGGLARIAMLDTRQYRTDQPNGDGNKPLEGAVFDPHATMLGREQEGWLMSQLLQSTGSWNVLGQQVMMGRVDRRPGAEAKFSMDQWAGYDVARKRLLQFLADREISNPVVLTGDIHSNWVNDLKVDFDRSVDPTVATEFVGTSISSGGNGVAKPEGVDQVLSENPFVKFANAERGYVSCTVTPTEWRSDYQVVEFVDKPDAPKITRQSFVVEAGRPGAQLA